MMRLKLRSVAALLSALFLSVPALAEVPIDVGETALVRLSPQGELSYPVATALPHAPANFGAILSFEAEEAGRYHIALGAPGWIDVVRDGKALASVGHRHGDPGSGIAKIVDFDLVPGRYVLALSAMAAGEASVTISR